MDALDGYSRGTVAETDLALMERSAGGVERAPVLVARGEHEGPTVWCTANLHGNEQAGASVIHRLVDDGLVRGMHGTVVAVPTLNPSGFIGDTRNTVFDRFDPNRRFPDFRGPSRRSPVERVNGRVFDAIEATADMVVDLHCWGVDSVPVVLLDRVFATGDHAEDAEDVAARVRAIAAATGLPQLRAAPPERYIAEGYHRALSGALVNDARIPAITVEIGPKYRPPERYVDEVLTAIRRLLDIEGVIDGPTAESRGGGGGEDEGSDEQLRRATITAETSGVLQPTVSTGSWVEDDEEVAVIRDIYGNVEERVRAPADCWIFAFKKTPSVHAGDELAYVGIEDRDTLHVDGPTEVYG